MKISVDRDGSGEDGGRGLFLSFPYFYVRENDQGNVREKSGNFVSPTAWQP